MSHCHFVTQLGTQPSEVCMIIKIKCRGVSLTLGVGHIYESKRTLSTYPLAIYRLIQLLLWQ